MSRWDILLDRTNQAKIKTDYVNEVNKENEKKYWKELLLLGIEKQEIKNSVNVEVEKLSFMEIYYGYSYMSMTTPNGYDTNCLLEKFQHLYFKLAH